MNNREFKYEFKNLCNDSVVKDIQKQIKQKIEAREFRTSLMEKMYLLTEGVGKLSKEVEKTNRNLELNNKINSDENLEDEIVGVYNCLIDLSELLNIDIGEKIKEVE